MRRQINARHVGGIISGSRQAQDGAGVLSGFRVVQPHGTCLLDIVLYRLLIALRSLITEKSGTAQADHRPLAANRACGKRILLL